MSKTTFCLGAMLMLVTTMLFAPAASAGEPPTTEQLQEKIGEFMEWYRAAPAEDKAEMAAKMNEVFGDIDFESLDMEGIQVVGRYVAQSPELQERIDARLAVLAEQDGAQGAAASAMAIESSFGDPEAMSAAIRKTMAHPGFAEAMREGLMNDMLGMLGYVPDDVLIELKDDVVALAPYFEDGSTEMIMRAGTGYVVTLNKLHDHVPAEKREAVRVMIRDRFEGIAEDPEAEERQQEYAGKQVAFLDGNAARGKLLGHEAPALTFSWTSTDGEFETLADLEGKVVVLDFWATWCGPCIASFPNVAELQERYRDYDVAIVGVTSLQDRHYPGGGQDPVSTEGDPDLEYALMVEFMAQKEMSWIVAFSAQDVFNPDFGVRGIPHLAIVDAEGKVRYNGLHPGATSLEEKAKKIDGLLEEAGLPMPAPVDGAEG